MDFRQLALTRETNFINGSVMLFGNESVTRDFCVNSDGFYNLKIDYKHYDWDQWVFVDVKHNTDNYRYMPSLPCDVNTVEATLKLFKGTNTITLTHAFGHELFISEFSVSDNPAFPEYSVTPTTDCFYSDRPAEKHVLIYNYGDKLVSVKANDTEIPFDCFPTKNATEEGNCNGYDTFKCDVVLNIQKAKLSEGKYSLKYTFESGKAIFGNLEVFDVYKKAPFKIISFDVGNAGSSLFCLPNGKHLLVDSGDDAACKRNVIPYLKRNGITVDYYLLTHFHSDHYGCMEDILTMFNIQKPSRLDCEKFIADIPERRYEFLKNYAYLDSGMICTYDEIDKIWDLGGVTMRAMCSRFDENGKPYGIGFNPDIAFNEHNYENATSVSFIMHHGNFGYYHGADNYAYSQQKNSDDFKASGKEDLLKCDYFYANHHFHVDVNFDFIRLVNPKTVYVPANCSVYSRSAYAYDYKDNVENADYPDKRLTDTLITDEIGTAVIEVYSDKTTVAAYWKSESVI